MAIQWFPGHMNKAKKAIGDRMKSVDMVIEVLDARCPGSSANPLLESLSGRKPKLKILTKIILCIAFMMNSNKNR